MARGFTRAYAQGVCVGGRVEDGGRRTYTFLPVPKVLGGVGQDCLLLRCAGGWLLCLVCDGCIGSLFHDTQHAWVCTMIHSTRGSVP